MKGFNLVMAAILLLWTNLSAAKPVTVSRVKAMKPRLFVVAVGINDYEDSFFPDLRWAERDAQGFADSVGVDTDFEVVRRVLRGRSVTAEALRSELQAVAVQASGRDAVLIYLSSHGSLVAGKDGELEPVLVLSASDSKSLTRTALPLSTVLQWMGRIPASKKFMITAACHSGVGKSRLTPDIQERLAQAKGSIELQTASEGIIVLSAAARNEVAVEDNKLRSDLYTYFFLAALTVYDRNQNGSVSLLEAHDYATEMAFRASGGKQRPTIQAEAVGNVDVPLRGKPTRKGLPVLAGYDDRFSGLEVEVNQQPKGRLPFAFPLRAGRNEVVLFAQDGAERLGRFLLTADAGETVSVDDILSGHPLAAGFYFARLAPVSRAFSRLAGNSLSTTGFLGRFRTGRFELGLDIQVPVRFEAQALSGLNMAVEQRAVTLRPGLRLLDLGDFSAVAELVVGQDEATVRVSDRNTGYAEEEASRATLAGAGLGVYWTVWDTMLLSVAASREQAQHDFGGLGRIDMSRRQTTFGVRFTFGGKARKR
jgi:uncharacterized caspase-like protein